MGFFGNVTPHGFYSLILDINLPLAYDAAADQKSWEEMQGFLKTIFKR